MMYRLIAYCFAVALGFQAWADAEPPTADDLPVMRWGAGAQQSAWHETGLEALRTHAAILPQYVPADIETWCPYYTEADVFTREAFWIGFLSALAKHESTYKPTAVGGGNRWFGLTQISPGTARGYGCRAKSGAALKDGGDNLSCAFRIMAVTVPRDGVIHARSPKWSGVSADWGPMRSSSKRGDMAAWLNAQPFCQGSVSPNKPEPKPKRRRFNSPNQ